MIVLKIFGKIILLPVVGVLSLFTAFATFVLALSGVLLGIASVFVFLMALLMLATSNILGGIVFLFLAFLISPFGLPSLAGWLIERIADLNDVLKRVVFG